MWHLVDDVAHGVAVLDGFDDLVGVGRLRILCIDVSDMCRRVQDVIV